MISSFFHKSQIRNPLSPTPHLGSFKYGLFTYEYNLPNFDIQKTYLLHTLAIGGILPKLNMPSEDRPFQKGKDRLPSIHVEVRKC